MKEPRRYAAGTEVEVSRSQEQIKRLVMQHGATGFLLAEGSEGGPLKGVLQFKMNGRMLRYERVYPSFAEYQHDAKGRQRKSSHVERMCEDEWRRRWRALQMIIKAKLEMIEAGDVTFEHEFLADILLPEGGTVGEVMGPQLAVAYETGAMPKLLPG